MGYYTDFKITIKDGQEDFYKSKENIVEEIQKLSLKGDNDSLLKIKKLVEDKDKDVLTILFEELHNVVDGYIFDLNGDIIRLSSAKWYKYEGDLTKVSKALPLLLIQVDGEGEESGDVWRRYYLGGKVQSANVKLIYEDFDPKKLI